jgi:hypothetical protein
LRLALGFTLQSQPEDKKEEKEVAPTPLPWSPFLEEEEESWSSFSEEEVEEEEEEVASSTLPWPTFSEEGEEEEEFEGASTLSSLLLLEEEEEEEELQQQQQQQLQLLPLNNGTLPTNGTFLQGILQTGPQRTRKPKGPTRAPS